MKKKSEEPRISFIQKACGNRHGIGITEDGVAYSWGKSNGLGQLGRDTSKISSKTPGPIPLPVKACKAFVSNECSSGSGHSAILDEKGHLWMSGCDRWQQLGLGSSNAGASGYTWPGGRIWQERFVSSPYITDLMQQTSNNNSTTIRDVSLGEDHTLLLSSNQRDVYAFGKGGDRQLGLTGKPFVSTPIRSTVLSSSALGQTEDSLTSNTVFAVCAIQSCSITLGKSGNILNKVGKCRTEAVLQGIGKCISRARDQGLIEYISDENDIINSQ